MATYDGRRTAALHPDGQLFINQYSDSIHDFQFNNHEEGPLRGVAYEETGKTYTFLGRHESMEDIVNTASHEPEHIILSEFQMDAEDTLIMDIREEHNAIRNVAWMPYIFDENTYISIFNGKQIEPSMRKKEYDAFIKRKNEDFDIILAGDYSPI